MPWGNSFKSFRNLLGQQRKARPGANTGQGMNSWSVPTNASRYRRSRMPGSDAESIWANADGFAHHQADRPSALCRGDARFYGGQPEEKMLSADDGVVEHPGLLLRRGLRHGRADGYEDAGGEESLECLFGLNRVQQQPVCRKVVTHAPARNGRRTPTVRASSVPVRVNPAKDGVRRTAEPGRFPIGDRFSAGLEQGFGEQAELSRELHLVVIEMMGCNEAPFDLGDVATSHPDAFACGRKAFIGGQG